MQHLAARRRALWGVVVVAVAMVVTATSLLMRKHAHDSRLRSLYEQAIRGSPSDVLALSEFRDEHVPAILSVMSTDKHLAPSVRAEAIHELWRNNWQESGECVLVEWNEPFEVIDATLQGVKSHHDVSDYCVKQMLRYKQYAMRDYPSKANAPFRSDTEEKTLASEINELLRSVPEATASALNEMYALGTDQPNNFGFTVAVDLRLTAACSLIHSSSEGLARRLGGYTPKEVKDAELALCRTRSN